MVLIFLDYNTEWGGVQRQRRRRQRERQKGNRLISAKQQLCPCITLFCIFLSHHCKSARWNFLIWRARFMELVNRAQNFLFLNQILLDSTPHNFTKILQIEWIWVRSLKFETERIQYLSDVFGLLSSRNFATMVTWRNDFSSLLIFQKKKIVKHIRGFAFNRCTAHFW